MGATQNAADAAPPAHELLPPDEFAHLRRKLQETAHPCGCKSGAALSLLAIVAWPVWTLTSGPPHTPLGIVLALLAYPMVVLVAGFAGKLAGILTGGWRHRRLRRRLAQHSALSPALAAAGER
jgi:hypothetical protein